MPGISTDCQGLWAIVRDKQLLRITKSYSGSRGITGDVFGSTSVSRNVTGDAPFLGIAREYKELSRILEDC